MEEERGRERESERVREKERKRPHVNMRCNFEKSALLLRPANTRKGISAFFPGADKVASREKVSDHISMTNINDTG